MKKSFLLLLFFMSFAVFALGAPDFESLRGCRGTYNNPPRLANKRMDLPRLIDELVEMKANTYNFLIHHQATDWDDLHEFLPLARAKNIMVWVSLVPPSESAPVRNKAYAEPFRLDYVRWAEEIGRLSAREPNLVAWSIDDFPYNMKFYTREMLTAMRAKSREHNPRLAFVPCVYYRQVTPAFVAACGDLIDGILFPYRSESTKANLKDPAHVAEEIAKIRKVMGRPMPIILDVYATAHSTLGASTPEYVREVMESGRQAADGVLVYCHQDKNKSAEKYNIIKTLFNQWAGAAGAEALPKAAAGR